jgi:hypothetical protein
VLPGSSYRGIQIVDETIMVSPPASSDTVVSAGWETTDRIVMVHQYTKASVLSSTAGDLRSI